MLGDLETALADVLGTRLGPPFSGNVHRLPGPSGGNGPALLVGVAHADVLLPDFGSIRPETVPGADDPRRVVRLRATVEITVRATGNGGRDEEIAGVDATAYALEAPDVRDGSALLVDQDPGFALEWLSLLSVAAATRAGDPAVIRAEAVGWFWPPGTPGEAGEAMREMHARGAFLPVAVEPWPLQLRAGDPTIDLTLRVRAASTVVPAGPTGFGALAVRVLDLGGRPGAGSLAGGTSGLAGARIVELGENGALVRYTPPAEAASDQLVVAVAHPDTGAGAAIGVELARFVLEVVA